MENILVTGGAGFIGSNFVHYMLRTHPDYRIVVYDKLTYAGNPDNLQDVAQDPRFAFVLGDICDAAQVHQTIQQHNIDTIVNFAAETHVDRSLADAGSFVMTDVYGTFVLLEAAKELQLERFHQVSTDEVYGQVLEGASVETDRIETRSPYSASKAGADLMVLAYHTSFVARTNIRKKLCHCSSPTPSTICRYRSMVTDCRCAIISMLRIIAKALMSCCIGEPWARSDRKSVV